MLRFSCFSHKMHNWFAYLPHYVFSSFTRTSKHCAFILYSNIRRKHSDFCFGKPLPSGRHYSSWLDCGGKDG